jgi:hypothetical protein
MASLAGGALALLPARALPAQPHGVVATTFHDARRDEQPAGPDITGVTVTRRADGTVALRIRIANRRRLTPDIGVEVVLDLDGNESTGDRTLRLGLGVDRLVTVLDRRPRLERWSAAGHWQSAPPPLLHWSRGTAEIVLSAGQIHGARSFRFAVSVASGMVPRPDGSIDITNARFDFAPDVGLPAWTFPCRTVTICRS